MKKVLAYATALFLTPVLFVSATTGNGLGGNLANSTSNFTAIANNLTNAANALIPFFFAIALIYFIWGVVKYILAKGPEDKKVARDYIIYGIIGIAVILSIYGLVRLLQNFVGAGNNTSIPVPTVTNS